LRDFDQKHFPNPNISGPFKMNLVDMNNARVNKWKSNFPPLKYYDFTLTTKPHPFMSINKFMSGRFHQFRVLKSYLATHQSRHNENLSTRCPISHDEE
jgi:hypothetical protein